MSVTVPITIRTTAPQLFTVDGKNVMGAHANGDALDKTAPAAPAETIKLYATGLGQTSPPLITGQLNTDAIALARLPQVTIDGTPATVTAAGVVAGSPGVYEITVQVPSTAANGDLQVIVQVGTTGSPAAVLTVQK
jgi:uncharacterized protein (TIGR03437 family)